MPAYLYAILRAAEAQAVDLPVVGPSAGNLQCTPMGRLALAWSPIDAPEALPSRRNMLAHTKILEAMNRQGPILPCRFGMIAPSVAALEKLVLPQQASLLDTLSGLEGRIELGLRITLHEQATIARIVASEPRLREISQRAERAHPRDAHRLRLDLGREVASHLAATRAAVARQVTGLLADWAERSVVHATSDDLTAFHGAFLVRAADEAKIIAAIERYDGENSDWLAIRCVVPAPPYNFVAFSLARAAAAA